MRVFIRTSGWAIWAARVARPILPLVLLSVLLHYIGVLTSAVFAACVVLAIALALLSFLLGIAGYVNIWYSGDSGWRESSSGVFVGLIAIVFVASLVFFAGRYPATNDVSTAPNVTPKWGEKISASSSQASLVDGQAFVFAETRQYKLDEQTALELISQAAKSQGWKKLDQSRSSPAELHQYFEARTLLGFVDDVTISTRTTAQLVIVNLRSASRFGEADFGANSRRIEQFLLALDELVASVPEVEEAS